MKIKITQEAKKSDAIVAECEEFYAKLSPQYDSSSSHFVYDSVTYDVALISEGAELKKNGAIVCSVKELQRTLKNTRSRKLIVLWQDSTIEIRQFLDEYKIFDKNGKKLGRANRTGLLVRGINAVLKVNREENKLILAFVATLIGHLWKIDLQANKIHRKGGLAFLAEEPEPKSIEAILGRVDKLIFA